MAFRVAIQTYGAYVTISKIADKVASALQKLFGLLFPAQPYVRAVDKLYGGLGAWVGIFGLVWLARYFNPEASLLVVASMGASAVLLFAAPHSPLAQPWAFVGGHILSALSGVTCYLFIPDIFMAAAAAVALAILLMHFLHCLHPPGGATALFAVMGGDAVHQLGYGYVLAPVGLNVALFLTLALLINNLLIPKRKYPLLPTKSPVTPTPSPLRSSVERSDIEEAVKEMGGYIDVSEADLEDITTRATWHARQRLLAASKVSDIMQTDVTSCVYGDELDLVWELMRSDRNKGIPVIDRAKRVIGIVTLVDFLNQVKPLAPGTPIERLSRLIRPSSKETTDKPEVAGQIMTSPAITVRDDARLESLIALFAGDKIHHLPVVDAEQRLIGMVTQADLIETLRRREAN